jgi:hypothetical protein
VTGRAYPGLTAEAIAARQAALQRFARWEDRHPAMLTPSAAVAAASALYDMLSAESRSRPVDPAGVMTFHALLSRADPAGR